MEDLAEGLEVASVEGELDDLVWYVNVAAEDIPGPPPGQLARLALGHSVVPHQLPAPANTTRINSWLDWHSDTALCHISCRHLSTRQGLTAG